MEELLRIRRPIMAVRDRPVRVVTRYRPSRRDYPPKPSLKISSNSFCMIIIWNCEPLT